MCPGTSTWQTIVGSYDNALGNLLNAAENGRKNGAKGYLVTDWGDHGHWQPQLVSYPGFLYGAAVSWAVDANKEQNNVPNLLDTHVFQDKGNTMGKLVKAIGKGSAYNRGQRRYFSVFRALTVNDKHSYRGNPTYTKEELEGQIAYMDKTMEMLADVDMRVDDADLLKKQLQTAVAMAKMGCKIGIAQKVHGAPIREVAQIPLEERLQLADELEQVIYDFKEVWLQRNRIGGLPESAGRMEGIVRTLRKK